ncbi:MAG: hypothetical protein M3Y87_07235 [Myxococcota bacterium]|nr:hypothetical protein [Myxococcota bacterium]
MRDETKIQLRGAERLAQLISVGRVRTATDLEEHSCRRAEVAILGRYSHELPHEHLPREIEDCALIGKLRPGMTDVDGILRWIGSELVYADREVFLANLDPFLATQARIFYKGAGGCVRLGFDYDLFQGVWIFHSGNT